MASPLTAARFRLRTTRHLCQSGRPSRVSERLKQLPPASCPSPCPTIHMRARIPSPVLLCAFLPIAVSCTDTTAPARAKLVPRVSAGCDPAAVICDGGGGANGPPPDVSDPTDAQLADLLVASNGWLGIDRNVSHSLFPYDAFRARGETTLIDPGGTGVYGLARMRGTLTVSGRPDPATLFCAGIQVCAGEATVGVNCAVESPTATLRTKHWIKFLTRQLDGDDVQRDAACAGPKFSADTTSTPPPVGSGGESTTVVGTTTTSSGAGLGFTAVEVCSYYDTYISAGSVIVYAGRTYTGCSTTTM